MMELELLHLLVHWLVILAASRRGEVMIKKKRVGWRRVAVMMLGLELPHLLVHQLMII